MNRAKAGFALALGLTCSTEMASASTPTVIAVAGGIYDMVYDNMRHVLYMTTLGPNVLRFSMTSKTFLTPLQVRGNFRGIDLSPDSNTLALADSNGGGGQVSIDLYDLRTDAVTRISGVAGNDEGGTGDVAYDSFGRVAVAGAPLAGVSGFVSMHVADPKAGTLSLLNGYVTDNTVVRTGTDHSVIAFTEGNISDGPWGKVHTGSGTLKTLDETGWFTYDVAVAPKGKFFAVPTAAGTFVYTSGGKGYITIGMLGQSSYDGAVFDPNRSDILYQSLENSSTIEEWNVTSGRLIRSYDTGFTLPPGGNQIFEAGYMRISSDGHHLFVKTSAGAVAIHVKP